MDKDEPTVPLNHNVPEDTRDMGFGRQVSQTTHARFLNRDGSFNVRRTGLRWSRSFNRFHALVTVSWGRLYAMGALAFLVTNTVFAMAYVLCGPGGLAGVSSPDLWGRFVQSFFFSVHTLATIGYGNIHPNTPAANLIVMIEALVGLCGFALFTGLIFARFSRPMARILFSEKAVIAPYHGQNALEFRIINMAHNELLEVEAEVTFSRVIRHADGKSERRFDSLSLERDKVVFFPLQWTIVHAIDKSSPLWGMTEHDLHESSAEFIILLRAVDETFSQPVITRSSYTAPEIVWGARFVSMFVDSGDGVVRADVRKLDETEPAQLTVGK